MKEKALRRMTYRELENRLAANRRILRTAKDPVLKRRLIAEDHGMMTEMDRRWEAAQR